MARRKNCPVCGARMLRFKDNGQDRWKCPRENTHAAIQAQARLGGVRKGAGAKRQPHYCPVCGAAMNRHLTLSGWRYKCRRDHAHKRRDREVYGQPKRGRPFQSGGKGRWRRK